MVVEHGRLVEFQFGSDSWYVRCKWCEESTYFSLDRKHGGTEVAQQNMEGLSWRLSMKGHAKAKRPQPLAGGRGLAAGTLAHSRFVRPSSQEEWAIRPPNLC